jgi:glutamine amidotransferase
MQNIVIIDYGMANLRSVQKALEQVGFPAIVSGDPEVAANADKLILPGVGAFRDAVGRLRETHLDEPILAHIRSGKPFLGVCLGLQLLFSRSFEDGEHRGLGVFEGDVVRFPQLPGLKVPHMGWNQLHVRRPAPLYHGLPDESAVYFVHSYCVVPKDRSIIATETDYPTPFTSSVWKDNVVATQFHPEKSQRVGLTMLRNFAAL